MFNGFSFHNVILGNLCIGPEKKGPCQHSCDKNKCICPDGYKLQDDDISCKGLPRTSPAIFLEVLLSVYIIIESYNSMLL